MSVNMRKVDLNLLNIFASLMVEPNLTLTAKKLNMTQPAVSMALQRLRTLYNDPLFFRKGRAMEPTSKAKELSVEINRALEIIKLTLPDINTFDPKTVQMRFKLNMYSYAEQLLASKFIEVLSTEAPKCSLTISSDYLQNPEQLLRNREVDIHLNYVDIKHPDFFSAEVHRDTVVVVCRGSHPRLGNKDNITLEEFLNEKHAVSTEREEFKQIKDSALSLDEETKLNNNKAYFGSSMLGALSIVSQTDMISMIPESLGVVLSEVFDIKMFKSPVDCHDFVTYMSWYSGVNHEHSHRWFRDLMHQTVEKWEIDIDNKKRILKNKIASS